MARTSNRTRIAPYKPTTTAFEITLKSGDVVESRSTSHEHCTNAVAGLAASQQGGMRACDCGGWCSCHKLLALAESGATAVQLLRAQQLIERRQEHLIECPGCGLPWGECICPCSRCQDTGKLADGTVCPCSRCPECGAVDPQHPLKIQPPCGTCARAVDGMVAAAERKAGWDSSP